MATPWRKYEVLILINATIGNDGIENLINKSRGFVTDAGGRMLKTVRWGFRDMAYEIKRQKRAYYVLLEFAGESKVATNLEHQLNLIDEIVKYQVVKLAEGVDSAALPEIEEHISAPVPTKAPIRALEKDEDEEGEEGEGEEFSEEDA